MSSETVSETPKENLTDHCYDGIQEYDNPLPGWWLFLFWLFIVFAPAYVLYFHLGVESRTMEGQYDQQMENILQLRFAELGDLKPDRETILKYMDDPKWLAVGKVVYKTNCVSCHGPDGGGIVGPNLTDDYWKNVQHVEDIVKIIQNGAANGAMPAWKNRLSHINQIVLTASYIASMRSQPVPGNGKQEGSVIPPWGQ